MNAYVLKDNLKGSGRYRKKKKNQQKQACSILFIEQTEFFFVVRKKKWNKFCLLDNHFHFNCDNKIIKKKINVLILMEAIKKMLYRKNMNNL